MANIAEGKREHTPRKSWTPPPIPASHENDDIDSTNVDQHDTSYPGHRFRETRRHMYPGTPDLEDNHSQRKKRHIESDDETSMTDGQAMSTGPYFDAIRNTYTASTPSVPLSQESLRALSTRSGQSSTRVRGWLRDSTQFSVDMHRRKKHSVEYMLQEDATSNAGSLPVAPSQPQIPREQHECVNCKRLFNTKSELRHHARRYEKRPYNCDQCERSFLYPKDLRRHKTTHDGSKSYQCSSCQKAFSRKDNLRRHMANEHGKDEASYDEAPQVIPMNPDPASDQIQDQYNGGLPDQDAMGLLASAIKTNRSISNEQLDDVDHMHQSRNPDETQTVNDHLVDPSMQSQRHHLAAIHMRPNVITGIEEPSPAQQHHNDPRRSSTSHDMRSLAQHREQNDVVIAQKALGWDEDEQCHASTNTRTEMPTPGASASLQTLEVS